MQKQSTVNTLALTRIGFGWQGDSAIISNFAFTFPDLIFYPKGGEAFEQHDVQELNRIMCDRLEKQLAGTKVGNVVKDCFEGRMKSYLKCLDVDYQSSRYAWLSTHMCDCSHMCSSFQRGAVL